MKRMWYATGLLVALGVFGLSSPVSAANPDTARTAKRPGAAMLMRLARAQQLSSRPRTFQTQAGVAVAARRHADAMEQQKRTLAILNNQYLRGTAATTPSETDIRQTIGVLEQQLNAPNPPENAYEVRYYLAACYESLENVPKAKELLQAIITQHGSSNDDIAKSFVEQARADLTRLGG
jgi:hypothetical protein